MQKSDFLFHTEWYEELRQLSPDDQRKVLRAITAYGTGERSIVIGKTGAALFARACGDIDRDAALFDKICDEWDLERRTYDEEDVWAEVQLRTGR